jgi:hypothetical protein
MVWNGLTRELLGFVGRTVKIDVICQYGGFEGRSGGQLAFVHAENALWFP